MFNKVKDKSTDAAHSLLLIDSIKDEPMERTIDEQINFTSTNSEDIFFIASYKGEPIEPGQIKDEPTERYSAENAVPFLKTEDLKIKLERSNKIIDKLTQSVLSKNLNDKSFQKAKEILKRKSNASMPAYKTVVIKKLTYLTTYLQSLYLSRLQNSLGKNFNKLNRVKHVLKIQNKK